MYITNLGKGDKKLIMKNLTTIITLLLLCIGSTVVVAQKVKTIPEKYIFPKDFDPVEDAERYEIQLNEEGKVKDKNNGLWYILSDRNDNQVYAKPKEDSEVVHTLSFKDYAYVIEDDEKNWLKIGYGRIKDNKFTQLVWEGWIPRSNIVMGPYALVNKYSNIHVKAFLLNKAQNFAQILKDENWQLANLYDGPNEGSKPIGSKSIYEFYFILKKQGNRSLLVKDYFVKKNDTEASIVGWVDNSKLDYWATRISLEPNFEEGAFEERKANPDLRVLGFKDLQSSNNYSKFMTFEPSALLWDQDPVKLPETAMSSLNPRRLNGQVIRFPMLKKRAKSYRSGSIGEINTKSISSIGKKSVTGKIPEHAAGVFQEILHEANDKRTNLNVFFVVEGTASMAKNKVAIINTIEYLDKKLPSYVNINFGASFYRDVDLRSIKKDFELCKLSENKAEVVQFFNNGTYDNFDDFDAWTNMRYGLYQSLLKGGFSEEKGNIVILIGNNSDFSTNMSRKLVDESVEGGKYVPKNKDIEKLAAKYEINFVVYQPELNSSDESVGFSLESRGIIENLSSRLYDNLDALESAYPSLAVPTYTLPEIEILEESSIKLTNAALAAYIKKPAMDVSFDGNELKKFCTNAVEDCQTRNNKTHSTLSNIINNGEGVDFEVSSGNWEPAIAHIINRAIESAKLTKNISEEDLSKIVDRKYKLFSQVYLPLKLEGADHPLFSYVVFMPKIDFDQYTGILGDLDKTTMGSPDKQREGLYYAFISLIEKFSGEQLSKREKENMSIDDLRSLMQGLELEGGYYLGSKLGFNIGDILDDRRLPDEEIEKIVERIVKKKEHLVSIQNQGDSYPFIFMSAGGFRYYWLPAQFLF